MGDILPFDIKVKIMQFLLPDDANSVFAAARVNKEFLMAAKSPSVRSFSILGKLRSHLTDFTNFPPLFFCVCVFVCLCVCVFV